MIKISKRRNRTGVNPHLISMLCNLSPENIPDRPVRSLLPGKYIKIISKKMKYFPWETPSNLLELTCEVCNKTDNYDLGLIALNVNSYRETINKYTSKDDNLPDAVKMLDYTQARGYFRCYFCNEAGHWALTEKSEKILQKELFLSFIKTMEGERFNRKNKYFFGELVYAGGKVKARWATDVEDYYLGRLKKDSGDAYLWNRLGNLYFSGRRFDLAASAYEKSLEIDPRQTESLFSLGKMLFWSDEDKDATNFLRQALISAYCYNQLEDAGLREMLTESLRKLMQLSKSPEEFIEMLPKEEEILSSHGLTDGDSHSKYTFLKELELDFEDPQTFFPLAEIYMGKRGRKLSSKMQNQNSIESKAAITGEKRSSKKKKKGKKKRK